MVDDQNQRPYRSGNTPGRVGPSGNDPLAELARLIGQNDPFGEFGRTNARAETPAQQPQQRPPSQAYVRPEPAQPAQRPQPSYPPQPQFQPHQTFEAPDYGRPNYASPPLAGGDDLYHTGAQADAYPSAHSADAYDPYDPNRPPLGADDQDYYDEPPPRRRTGVMAIAAIFALAVIGTAGAFGYRALFGTTSSGPPPLIKADARPSKVVPEAKDSKQIVDRIAGGGQGEKLVSREEHPVEIKPVGVFPQQGAPAAGMMQPQGNGTGAMTGEPKKIRTIVIRPDQQSTGSAPTQVAAPLPENQGPAPSSAPVNIAPVRQASPQPEQIASAAGPEPMSAPAAAPRPTTIHSTPPRPSNAPLSLNPNAEPAAPAPRVASAPAQVAPQPQASGGSGYAVQLSSRRSEDDAQAAFRALQSKFPGQLGSREPLIRRVDLGEKGIYFRAMVGPFGSSDEANRLCSSLKSAGGSCFVQRI